MDLLEAMRERHSVRSYLDRPIEAEKTERLEREIAEINAESGLKIRLFTEEPEAFGGRGLHYGAIKGCRNYFALAGQKNKDEQIGYYGERLVLLAQTLGLNTCWVALTYQKSKVVIDMDPEEKLYVVIALGYGANPGVPHKSKPLEEVAKFTEQTPRWFLDGMKAVLLAPTAINQQRFYFSCDGDQVLARAKKAFYAKMDLGIAKYHFELGAGGASFHWAESERSVD